MNAVTFNSKDQAVIKRLNSDVAEQEHYQENDEN
jgi:hypothetical protein